MREREKEKETEKETRRRINIQVHLRPPLGHSHNMSACVSLHLLSLSHEEGEGNIK